MRRPLVVIGYSLAVVALLNFVAFAVVAASIGGDALNGKIQNGRHYLGSKGTFTEVSPAVWKYSRMHSISVMVTHALGSAGALLVVFLRLRAQPPGQPAEPASHPREM